ncbi:unnamed protein product, partial [Mesorhabditis spiculigera]
MTDRFHDYVRELPMQIGRRFLPIAQVNLPVVQLPRLRIDELNYGFDAERRAQREYEDSERPVVVSDDSAHSSMSDDSKSNSASTYSNNNDFLFSKVCAFFWMADFCFRKSCCLPRSTLRHSHCRAKKHDEKPAAEPNFDEFVDRGTDIFDELDMKTLDDRAVLSQVLSQATQPLSISAQPQTQQSRVILDTSGVASFSASKIADSSQRQAAPGWSTPQSCPSTTPPPIPGHSANPTPPPVPNRQNTITPTTPTGDSGMSQLRARLLTKGYKENIVAVALERLPVERMQLVEYYMKSMRTMEKVGVDPGVTLSQLVACQLADKQKILDYGVTGAQLVQMGFTAPRSISALHAKAGDKVAALDLLLAGH